MAAEELGEFDAAHFAGLQFPRVRFDPALRLLHPQADQERHNGRQHTDQEQNPPAVPAQKTGGFILHGV